MVAASNFGTDAQSPNDPSIAIGGVGPGIGMNRKPAIRIANSVAAPMAAYRTRFEGEETRISFLPARTDRVPHDGHRATLLAPSDPQLGPVGAACAVSWPTRASSW